MKAVVCAKYGPPEVLQIKELEKPVPGDNELLIKVHAATVNRTDCAVIGAKPFLSRFVTGMFKPKIPIPGTEFAGVIEMAGEKVKSFKAGQKVFGFNETGYSTQAQYMTISEDDAVTTMPENVPYEQAAASTEGAHYAINFINKVNIKTGQRILVNGATGGIGSAMVQILKHLGVDITTVCGTENIELVKSLGAGKVFDYKKEDFTKSDEKYNFVFDAVGKSSFGKCKPLLENDGAYISSELGRMGQNVYLAILTPIFGKKKVVFPLPVDCRGSVQLVRELIENGKFKAVIDRKYPLEEIVEAYKYVDAGEKIGNVVITVGHDD